MDAHVRKWLIVNRRKLFPKVAAFGDMVREVFPNARTIWAKENGREIGKDIEGKVYTFRRD